MGFFSREYEWPPLSLEEIKKRARLVVIDNEEFPYLPLFRRDEYQIEHWPDVKDLPRLEENYFDIILLDIRGVGRDQTVDEGLGILRHLRQVSPAQIIIVYSSSSYPLSFQDALRQADAVLAKGVDYIDFKRKVDDLLRERFSLGFYLGRIRQLLASQVDDTRKYEKAARKAIRTRSSTRLQRLLESKVADPETIKLILSVVRVAAEVAALWMK